MSCDCCCIGRRRFGCRNHFGEPDECVTSAFRPSFLNPNLVTPAVFHGWTDIAPINAMRGPRAACRGHLVKDDLASEGAERRAIEIKAAIELLVR